MFFYTRYPSSTILRNYFPDVKFNKANTAQLVKWFSNFREFFYIQIEKYARQYLNEGMQSCDDFHVTLDSEIFRVLNLHYNRNNQIEVRIFCLFFFADLFISQSFQFIFATFLNRYHKHFVMLFKQL
jgi:hypothetical protein